ncbi:MAG: hypothetical protein VXW58_01720, partial [Pseudomonadota bacterium]|nr:hypothetical protein [Pseudomonadota bacterium]
GDWRTVSGIDFRGERSAATEHGFGPYSGGPVFGGWRREDGFSLIHDCTVSGLINGFSPGGADLAHAPEGRHYQMFADCACDEWRAMGVHGGSPGMHLSLTGTRLVQNVNAPNNGGKDGIRSNHGPIRISDCKYLYISGCDLFSRTFWDGADQPCLRMFTSGQLGQDGGVVERCTMEGGYQVVQMNSSDGGVLHPINVVYERLFLVASTYTTTFLDTARSGVTFRDNVLVRSNVPVLVASGNGEIQFRIEEPQSTGAGLYDEPIAIYGNTALNLLTDANDGTKDYPMVFIEGGANGAYFTNVVEENNVYHRPVGGEVVDTYAPIDTTTATAGFDSRYLGRQYNFDHYEFALGQDCEVGETLAISYSNIGDGLYEGTPSTGPTDQAYWLAVPDSEHELIIESFGGRSRRGYSETWGHINVTFGETEVTVENTSGETWLNGATARLWLDRSSLMPAMDGTYANPATIPLPRPQTGSPAIGAATAGRISPKDFLLTDRGETPSRGALEPA